MKEWQKELYIYRLSPAPPKKDDLQEYIDLYLAEKDETYLSWFLHYGLVNICIVEKITKFDNDIFLDF